MTELFIRPYQLKDRERVFRIGADTAFFGDPVEAYMEDRNIFLEAFYAYYTDVEAEFSWVACADEEVVGFLTGCADSRARGGKYLRFIIPGLLGKLLLGRFRIGKRTIHYVAGMAAGVMRGEVPRADLKVYPAHLHINVAAAWRGKGLGRRLMEAYLGQLRNMNVRGVYLDTSNLNEAACRLYETMGFRVVDSRLDRFWTKWFGRPVNNLCYGLILPAEMELHNYPN